MISTWQIPNDSKDGVKLIQANFIDYAGNNSSDVSNSKYFRTYKDLDNNVITAFIQDSNDLYYTFEGNETEGTPAYLYKNLNLLTSLDYDATSLCLYNDSLYIAIEDDEGKGILQVYAATGVETVRDNDDEYSWLTY